MTDATDYAISRADATELLGVVTLPHEFRVMALQAYAKAHGTEALLSLFSQVIGCANSVVENCREFVELEMIVAGRVHPERANHLNLPTLFGAMQGARVACVVEQAGMCRGCAYRLGSHANQSPCTAFDVEHCAADLEQFMCHEYLSDSGEPTRKCVGHQRALKAARTRANTPATPSLEREGKVKVTA